MSVLITMETVKTLLLILWAAISVLITHIGYALDNDKQNCSGK